jgi:lambda family phage tail tape measure protein
VGDLTYGVRLGGDSSKLVSETKAATDGFTALQKQTESLNASTSRMASSYTGMNAAVKENAAALTTTESKVTKLLDRYDPLGAKLRQLQADFKALDSAAAGGKVAGVDDSRVDAVYAKLQQEIAAAKNFGNEAAGSMDKVGFATHRAQQEMLVMSREIMSGNFSRIPTTFSIIAQGLSGPMLGGLGAVAVAAAAGAVIWESYGNSIKSVQEQIDKTNGDLGLKTEAQLRSRLDELRTAAAEKRTQASAGGWGWNQAADEAKVYEAAIVKVGKQIDANRALEEKLGNVSGEASKLSEQSSYARREGMVKEISLVQVYHDKQIAGSREYLTSLSALHDLKQKLAELDKKTVDPKIAQNNASVHALQTEEFKKQMELMGVLPDQIKVYEMAMNGATDANLKDAQAAADDISAINGQIKANKDHAKAVEEANKIISDIDPIAKASQEWEKLLKLHAQGLLTEEQMGKAYENLMGKTDKTAKAMSDSWKTFADNTQRTLSDVLYNGMNGKFSGIEDLFKQMLMRMLANAASAKLTEAMFGNKSSGGTSTGWVGALAAMFSANGNAFGNGNVMAFANGGAFSNQLYNSPTPFRFASGGGFGLGVMGEAGPEAVMPLTRDGTGKLGVRSQGGGGMVVQITDNSQIHIDGRVDLAQGLAAASKMMDDKQAKLVDTLRRQKAIG